MSGYIISGAAGARFTFIGFLRAVAGARTDDCVGIGAVGRVAVGIGAVGGVAVAVGCACACWGKS